MSTFRRLMTLMRGQARRGGEAVLDANALALLDQQLFETEQGLIAARRDLSSLMAERKLQDRRRGELAGRMKQYEGYVSAALEKQDEALAMETAEKVAELEERHNQLSARIEELDGREQEFRRFIADAADNLRELRQQQAVARVSERITNSSRRLGDAGNGLSRRLEESRETLDRIQARQERARLEWEAGRELADETGNGSLEQRLERAGIIAGREGRAREMVERLRQRGADA